jgi:ATP-dependent RNA helicase RhlE
MDQKAKTGFLIERLNDEPDSLSLVFCRTKHGAERLMRKLAQSGIDAGSIHGNKSQNQRDRAIRDLKEGRINVLVATDVAARGIDIPGVSHVYNFELPEVAEAYVHRIGRTARAGADGDAIALCAPEESGSSGRSKS